MSDTAPIAEAPKPRPEFFCSFCGKSQHDVSKLIAGPSVFVCDECVMLCMDILIKDTSKALEEARIKYLANSPRCADKKDPEPPQDKPSPMKVG